MDDLALLFSRLQFAFTISFHIIFPSFTIGLAAWLTILEALHLATGRPVYRVVFDFWLKIFGVTFGMGVVSGIVMAFQFGTNWEVLARMTGPIQGVLLTYETFTAFFLEASFFGILLFGRPRVPPWFYLLSTAMVALGTTLSAFGTCCGANFPARRTSCCAWGCFSPPSSCRRKSFSAILTAITSTITSRPNSPPSRRAGTTSSLPARC